MAANNNYLEMPHPPLKRMDSQVSLKCKLCNGQKNLKWRCMDCEFTICENCRDRHVRRMGHKVVPFSDIAGCNLDLRSADLVKKMRCKRHSKQTYNAFCETCNFLVCSWCNDEQSHLMHELVSIEQFVEDLDKRCAGNRDNREKIQKRPFNDSGYADLDTDCLKMNNLGHEMSKPDFEMDNLDRVNDNVFCQSRVDFDLIHTTTTQLPTINFMELLSPDESWIGGLNGNTISKIKYNKSFFNRKSSTSKSIDQIDGFEPLDVAISNRGELLFVCRFDKSVKLVTKNSSGDKQICDIANFSPLEPICIHSRKNDPSIYVGLTEGGHDFEIPKNCTRQVVEITQRGHILNIIEFSSNNNRLFTLPWRITKTMDGICVIDRTDRDKGRVVALDKSGQMIWEYTEKHPSRKQQPFLPTDIVTTGCGNIIVTDSLNYALHILSADGHLLSEPQLINLDIEMPLSLMIDERINHLWIGCDSDINSRSKRARIYELEFSGI